MYHQLLLVFECGLSQFLTIQAFLDDHISTKIIFLDQITHTQILPTLQIDF